MRLLSALLITGLCVMYSGLSFGQSTAATAVNISSVTLWNNNAPTTANHCLNAVAAQAPFSGGGVMTDVAWFKFTVPATLTGQPVYSASSRIQVVPTGFDAIVEYFSGPAGAPVFRQFVNAAGSGAQEVLRTDWTINVVSPGTEYFIRVSSATDVPSGCFTIGVQYYPGAHVRNGWSPYPSGQNPLVGYDYNEQVRRNIDTPQLVAFNSNVQATRFRLVDATLPPGSAGCTVEINGVVSTANLTAFSCVCYGITYNVFVQMRMDGVWTGETDVRQIIMKPYPLAAPTINSIPAGQCVTVPTSGSVQCSFVTSNTIFEWEWCTPGLSCFTVNGPAPGNTQCLLSSATCLKFGRTYTVRVRAQVCGQWTGWSSPRCVTVPQMPYAQVTNCPGGTVGNGTVLIATFINGVNQYVWLYTPIAVGSPMIPIGPAIIQTTSNNTTFLNSSIPNGVYRVQVKPRSTTCGLTQEGEYGQWCIIYKGVGYQGQFMVVEDEEVTEEMRSNLLRTEIEYYDYVANKPIEVLSLESRMANELTFSVLTSGMTGTGVLTMMNAAGQTVLEQSVNYSGENPRVIVPTPYTLSSGLYFVTFHGEHGEGATKVFLE
jgi:hypothetical protein